MSELTHAIRNQDRTRWWEIHDKDEYTCPDCGRHRDEIERWEVHHVGRQAHKIVGLCKECHWVRHGSERKDINLDAWKEAFLEIGAKSS